MGSIRRSLALIDNNENSRLKEKEKSSLFLENGSMLLEELIASWNGRCENPLRSFSAEEVLMATNNFDSQHRVSNEGDYVIHEGSLERRKIFVKQYGEVRTCWSREHIKSLAIRDIAVTTQMSSHKNVLKLIGCCLEFHVPALVYEYAGQPQGILSYLIYNTDHERQLSWKSRLRIANEIASAVLYLHTAFPRPIIHRNIKPHVVMIDESGVAKLFDFSLSIAIPLGELQVEDHEVRGTFGYLDPVYTRTGLVTEKSDVYGIGILLLELLIGKEVSYTEYVDHGLAIWEKDYLVDKNQLNQIVDPRILKEVSEGIVQELQAVAALALKCTQFKRDDRPEMVEVARELRRIERSIRPST